MALSLRDPTMTDPLGYFRGGFDRLFDDLTRDLMTPMMDVGGAATMGPGMGAGGGRGRRGRGVGANLLAMDMREMDDAYHCKIDCPGCDKEDISVSCDDSANTITVMCHRKTEKEEQETTGNWITRERPRRRGQRTIYFDANCDLNKADVKFEHGCLCLNVPKKEKGTAGGRQLQIQ